MCIEKVEIATVIDGGLQAEKIASWLNANDQDLRNGSW